MKKWLLLRSTIHDPRSAILHDSGAFVFIRGLNISARIGAAGRIALPAKETSLQEARFKRRSSMLIFFHFDARCPPQ
jgi:hypothetical protein